VELKEWCDKNKVYFLMPHFQMLSVSNNLFHGTRVFSLGTSNPYSKNLSKRYNAEWQKSTNTKSFLAEQIVRAQNQKWERSWPIKVSQGGGWSKTATGIQPQTFWLPWSRDFEEKLETHLTEIKDQGELKHQHSEPLARGRPLHTTIY
jgi:hypothetical protein